MDLSTLKRAFAITTAGEAFSVLDLTSNKSFLASKEKVESILTNHLVLLADGKAFLESSGVKPSHKMRILCLKTIEKLLPKEQVPHATAWLEKTERFLKISEQLGMGNLLALECQLLPAVVSMQERGIPFVKALWLEALNTFSKDANALKSQLNNQLTKKEGFLLFGEKSVDLNNPKEVKAAFKILTGQELLSTALSSLKDIPHEAASLLVKFRACERMVNTYGENFLDKIVNDRLRGIFEPLGASSGRFACHSPNLLALPNHPQFQACIKASEPYQIIHFDYNAFELRILAALSQDPAMIEIFDRDLDIHSMVAEAIFGQEVSKHKNPHLRDQAKIINFGLIYGMKEASLSKQLKISASSAKLLLENYFKKFSRIGEFLKNLEDQARSSGFAKTALGRRIFLEKASTDPQQARVARNIPIQGTGADIIKLAACRTFKQFQQKNLDAHIINIVHDEIVIEHSLADDEELKHVVKNEMEGAFRAILPHIKATVSC